MKRGFKYLELKILNIGKENDINQKKNLKKDKALRQLRFMGEISCRAENIEVYKTPLMRKSRFVVCFCNGTLPRQMLVRMAPVSDCRHLQWKDK